MTDASSTRPRFGGYQPPSLTGRGTAALAPGSSTGRGRWFHDESELRPTSPGSPRPSRPGGMAISPISTPSSSKSQAKRAVQGQVAGDIGRVAGIERLGQPVDGIGREAERLGDLAHRRAGAVGDDGADHGGVVLAVAGVEVLDDLLAAVDVEVDVDVRQRARLVDEALEEELVGDRVDLGDAQAVGHDRVTGAPPPLADDLAAPRELHQVPDDEEELGQVGAVDDVELVRQLVECTLGNRAITDA